jgi:transposase
MMAGSRRREDTFFDYPKEHLVQTWVDALHAIYADAVACTATAPTGPAGEPVCRAKCQDLERRLLALAAPHHGVDGPLRLLAGRLVRFAHELLTFLAGPGVPPDNNAAERSRRHLVTTRKITGGTCSPTGTDTDTKMALATSSGPGASTAWIPSRPAATSSPPLDSELLRTAGTD